MKAYYISIIHSIVIMQKMFRFQCQKWKLYFLAIFSLTIFGFYISKHNLEINILRLTLVQYGLVKSYNNRDRLHFSIQPKHFNCHDEGATPFFVKSTVEEFDSRQVIRRTWKPEAVKLGLFPMFSIGLSNDTSIMEKVVQEAEEFDDILLLNMEESYHRLCLKTFLNMYWSNQNCPHSKYVFFCDSDVLVFPRNLVNFIHNTGKVTNTIFGHCWTQGAPVVRDPKSKSFMPLELWPESKYPPYCSGTAYFMTGDVPAKLLGSIPNGTADWRWAARFDHLEDVLFTGLLRQRANVSLHHTENVMYETKDAQERTCQDLITVHSYRPHDVYREAWEKFVNKSRDCNKRNVTNH